jgi:pimeloyl-ACP methyl ester carboxylesterase
MPIAAGIHYFLHEAGSTMKPPLVLLHDAGGEYLSWPSEIRRLPETRVYTVDLPGHGKTGGLGRQYIADYAKSMIEFMNAAGLSRAVFGGHGMGGAIALSLAIHEPGRVAGTILISTGPRLPIPEVIRENGANPSTLQRAINHWQQVCFDEKTPILFQEKYCRRLSLIRQTLLWGDWLACDRFDVSQSIEKIRTPTLVICGTGDRLTPMHFSKMLSSRIPEAALQTVEAAGHMLILEQPAHVAKLMSVFLKTVPYTPGM